jgi:hypothetical protein
MKTLEIIGEILGAPFERRCVPLRIEAAAESMRIDRGGIATAGA